MSTEVGRNVSVGAINVEMVLKIVRLEEMAQGGGVGKKGGGRAGAFPC